MKNINVVRSICGREIEFLASMYEDSNGAEGAEPYCVMEVFHVVSIVDTETGEDVLWSYDEQSLQELFDLLSERLTLQDFEP